MTNKNKNNDLDLQVVINSLVNEQEKDQFCTISRKLSEAVNTSLGIQLSKQECRTLTQTLVSVLAARKQQKTNNDNHDERKFHTMKTRQEEVAVKPHQEGDILLKTSKIDKINAKKKSENRRRSKRSKKKVKSSKILAMVLHTIQKLMFLVTTKVLVVIAVGRIAVAVTAVNGEVEGILVVAIATVVTVFATGVSSAKFDDILNRCNVAGNSSQRFNKKTANDKNGKNKGIFPLMTLKSDNILLNVLSFLHFNDLNSIAGCNKRLRNVCYHNSLDQTRMAVLDFDQSTGESTERFLHYLNDNQIKIKRTFTGNTTALQLKGFVQYIGDGNEDYESFSSLIQQIPPDLCCNIKSLYLTKEKRTNNPMVTVCYFLRCFGTNIFSNLEHVDVSDSKNGISIDDTSYIFPNLVSITSNDGYRNPKKMSKWKSLREICLYDYSSSSSCGTIKYTLPPNIEKVDIRMSDNIFSKNIPECEIIDLVRSFKSLQWI